MGSRGEGCRQIVWIWRVYTIDRIVERLFHLSGAYVTEEPDSFLACELIGSWRAAFSPSLRHSDRCGGLT